MDSIFFYIWHNLELEEGAYLRRYSFIIRSTMVASQIEGQFYATKDWKLRNKRK